VPAPRTAPFCLAALAALLAGACGGSSAPAKSLPRGAAEAAPAARAVAAATPALREWPEFGLNPQRADATSQATGITAANVGHLRRTRVSLPGTVDSSPIYLHGVRVDGGIYDVIVVTTTYGRTVAIDARSGRILWTFTPASYGSLAGSAQVTTASPVADPDRRFVYAASPDGVIHKLALANGSEVRAGSWPVRITRDPTHEKIASALNIDGAYVIAVTGGYYGDAPPYQGHVVAIDRASGRIRAVFNTLCANRRRIVAPASCHASDSAMWSRAGAVVEPGGRRILVVTGNGPWNGSTDFGDSAIMLSFPGLRRVQAFTPTNERELDAHDTDLGSGGPALLGSGLALIGGKDSVLRVLDLARMDGRARPWPERLGGEAQRLPLPGGGALITQPAVWRHGGATSVFVGGEAATAAYALRRGRLHLLWQSPNPGSSPVLAGGLLYVYDPAGGGINVYRPSSPHPIAKLPGAPGHWNSPIVADGHVIEPEGNYHSESQHGTLEIFSAR
jgi:outer membrane protein assembly factor BamB